MKIFEVTTKRTVYRTYRVDAVSAKAAKKRVSGWDADEKPIEVKEWSGRCDKCGKIEPCMRAHRWS